ncbi:hypothetical protein [Salinarimonas soli]|uniref:YgjV family protein n=1 Tax=Salinarimonas soli TaxID=1638099 RepID=A0A5B2VVY3_9HYPH|nr:hypothetical protein [Salinarimonas soli]KAA2242326.1 hypothetical protein F0L46_03310 [Salinarimonas soli]
MMGTDALDLIGFAAAGMTVITFAQKRMLPMRLSAVGANVLFIAYGFAGGFYPILLLHLVLIPINLTRLLGTLRRSARLPSPQAPLMEDWRPDDARRPATP